MNEKHTFCHLHATDAATGFSLLSLPVALRNAALVADRACVGCVVMFCVLCVLVSTVAIHCL